MASGFEFLGFGAFEVFEGFRASCVEFFGV